MTDVLKQFFLVHWDDMHNHHWQARSHFQLWIYISCFIDPNEMANPELDIKCGIKRLVPAVRWLPLDSKLFSNFRTIPLLLQKTSYPVNYLCFCATQYCMEVWGHMFWQQYFGLCRKCNCSSWPIVVMSSEWQKKCKHSIILWYQDWYLSQ